MSWYSHTFLLFQGIEVVGGNCKLSCVTTNVYSDWSTQPWPTNRLAIRVYKLGNDFVVNDTVIKSKNSVSYLFGQSDGARKNNAVRNNPASYLCYLSSMWGMWPAVMLTSIQSAGVAPEVNLRTSAKTRKHASEKSTLTLNPRADITKSPKQGYISGPTKRTCVLQKILKKRKKQQWLPLIFQWTRLFY